MTSFIFILDAKNAVMPIAIPFNPTAKTPLPNIRPPLAPNLPTAIAPPKTSDTGTPIALPPNLRMYICATRESTLLDLSRLHGAHNGAKLWVLLLPPLLTGKIWSTCMSSTLMILLHNEHKYHLPMNGGFALMKSLRYVSLRSFLPPITRVKSDESLFSDLPFDGDDDGEVGELLPVNRRLGFAVDVLGCLGGSVGSTIRTGVLTGLGAGVGAVGVGVTAFAVAAVAPAVTAVAVATAPAVFNAVPPPPDEPVGLGTLVLFDVGALVGVGPILPVGPILLVCLFKVEWLFVFE